MKIILDENVCLRSAGALREDGHEVFAIAESAGKGLADNEVWALACEGLSLLTPVIITLPMRFDLIRNSVLGLCS